jgi:hypothetical protein
MNDAELARNYILDRLSEEDRDQCERRFLFDPEFESLMQEQERQLLDDYVNLRLSGEEAEAVLHRVAQEPGHLYRLRFAESLKRAAAAALSEKAAPAPVKVPKSSPTRRWRSFFAPRSRLLFAGMASVAALAVIVLIVFEAWSPQHRLPAPSTQTIAKSPVQVPSPASAGQPHPDSTAAASHANNQPSSSGPESNPASTSIATFVLLANQQRGAGNLPTVTLPSAATVLRLQLTTEEGLDPGRYSATLSAAQGANILAVSHLSPGKEAGRRYIDLRIPAKLLTAAEYSVDLTKESGSAPQLAFNYRFQLVIASNPAADRSLPGGKTRK